MKPQAQTIIGQSPALAAALDHLSTLATIDKPVLVLGERGTGKELAGERLHFLSPRWSGAFIKVNCGAITETLLESELFGHEAGAFTGATKQHIGRFERADGGTLFLDELGTMSLRLQEKLLRLIEYGEFERVGGQKTISVDVRIIAATNADLPAMANRGEFRWDLLDRLTFDVVRLPPLRERPEDIEELTQHFGVRMCADLGWQLFPGFSNDALEELLRHHWPGNVRELKNVVERSIFRWGESEEPIGDVIIDPFGGLNGITPSEPRSITTGSLTVLEQTNLNVTPPAVAGASVTDLSSPLSSPAWPIDLRALLADNERRLTVAALKEADGSQKAAAELLGLTYDQIRSLVRKHALQTRANRKQ